MISSDIENVSVTKSSASKHILALVKVYKNLIKLIFIIVSSKSSVKSLSQAITSDFRFLYRQIEPYNNKCRFCISVTTFWLVQSNKTILKTTIEINKRKKSLLYLCVQTLLHSFPICFYLIKTGKLCNVFNITDDLNTINVARIFESNFRDICPQKFELHKDNYNNAESTVLHLDI